MAKAKTATFIAGAEGNKIVQKINKRNVLKNQIEALQAQLEEVEDSLRGTASRNNGKIAVQNQMGQLYNVSVSSFTRFFVKGKEVKNTFPEFWEKLEDKGFTSEKEINRLSVSEVKSNKEKNAA